MGDVIDSTHMPINKGDAHGTQRERTNGVNFQHSILLMHHRGDLKQSQKQCACNIRNYPLVEISFEVRKYLSIISLRDRQ